jgi:hypothetical protein
MRSWKIAYLRLPLRTILAVKEQTELAALPLGDEPLTVVVDPHQRAVHAHAVTELPNLVRIIRCVLSQEEAEHAAAQAPRHLTLAANERKHKKEEDSRREGESASCAHESLTCGNSWGTCRLRGGSHGMVTLG